VYVGPSVGTNIDTTNLNLLSQDTNAAVNIFQTYLKIKKKTPIGLVSFSQTGWMHSNAKQNPQIEFMVLFGCPTIIL
jgi:hypothetical protein